MLHGQNKVNNNNAEIKQDLPDFSNSRMMEDWGKYCVYELDLVAELLGLGNLKKEALEKLAKGPFLSKGDPKAQFVWARKRWDDKEFISIVTERKKEWTKKSAQQGFLPAMLFMISEGSSSKEFHTALIKMEKAGNLDAKFCVAVCAEKSWWPHVITSLKLGEIAIVGFVELAFKGHSGAVSRLLNYINANLWEETALLCTKAREGNLEAAVDFSIAYLNLIQSTEKITSAIKTYVTNSLDNPLNAEIAGWLAAAANNGNVRAQAQLESCYKEGYFGFPVDRKIAQEFALKSTNPQNQLVYYQQKGEIGSPEAQAAVGHCYLEQKDSQAGVWLQKAEAQSQFIANNSTVEYDLGVCHEAGIGFPVNDEMAFDYYDKSAKKGNDLAKKALCRLTATLSKKYYDDKDKRAFIWLKRSVDQPAKLRAEECGQSEYYLAFCYESGLGVEKDYAMADRYFDEAVRYLYREHFYSDGKRISTYVFGPSQYGTLDYEKYEEIKTLRVNKQYQLNLLKQKSANNDATADYELGLHYLESKDDAHAFALFKKAVANNLAYDKEREAYYLLGSLSENGLGTSQSHKTALDYYKKAEYHQKAIAARTTLYKDHIFPTLKDDKTLTVLDLAYTNIDDTDLLLLQQLLTANTTITQLDLRYTQVTEKCAEKLANILKRSTGLEILHSVDKKSIVFPEIASPSQQMAQRSPTSNNSQDEEKLNLSVNYKIDYSQIIIDPKPIGKGGFAVVYKGKYDHSSVAVKQLKENVSVDKIKEFEREVQIMVQLQSQYLVRIYGYTLQPSCLVTEYLEKGSLYSLLRSSEKFEIQKRYKQISLDIAFGILHLHKKHIVHSDLKSLNILVNENYRAKVADFGLSDTVKRDLQSVASVQQAGGSTRWMAPEQFKRGAQKSTKESDIYSFGRTLFELATAKIPFEEAENAALIPAYIAGGDEDPLPEKTPKLLSNVIRLCLFDKPKDRPTIEEIVTMLQTDEEDVQQNNNTVDSGLQSGYQSNLASIRNK